MVLLTLFFLIAISRKNLEFQSRKQSLEVEMCLLSHTWKLCLNLLYIYKIQRQNIIIQSPETKLETESSAHTCTHGCKSWAPSLYLAFSHNAENHRVHRLVSELGSHRVQVESITGPPDRFSRFRVLRNQ